MSITNITNKYLNEMRDEENPEFLFQMTHTKLLVQIATKRLDPVLSAKKELVNRGLDKNGKWIGHEEARKYWKI